MHSDLREGHLYNEGREYVMRKAILLILVGIMFALCSCSENSDSASKADSKGEPETAEINIMEILPEYDFVF